LVNEIYHISKNSSFSKDFVLQNQIIKAALSIASNIAEGFERSANKEFINFLSIAKGSTGEVKIQLFITFDQCYIEETEFKQINAFIDEISRMLGGLMKYLSQSNMKGNKFNKYNLLSQIPKLRTKNPGLKTRNPELGT
jgi:four helix bundle protein